jgi:coenzyme F420-reducing hydrogenase delta subunit
VSINEANAWQPKIIVFACNWCSYAAADLAIFNGSARIRSQSVKCSGKMDPLFLLQSFENGADGIMVFGCNAASCLYGSQFEYSRNKHQALHEYLQRMGIKEGRFQALWPNLGRFNVRDVLSGFIQELKQLGPIAKPGENRTNSSYHQ